MRAVVLVPLFLAACAKAPPLPSEAPDLPSLDAELPFDPTIRRGQLDNGLQWFVETNREPEGRAVLRLFVDTGSVLEDEDQLGLAHFVEHMAFNGSEHFEGNELVAYLESVGTQFGAHLNAHTSFEETVYKLEVPTDDPEILDKAFVVFADWAQGISFAAEEIEKERGVVLEEWRTRLGAQGRVTDAMVPAVFHGSPYAERLPIGTEESLKGFEHAALERFYDDWYRPSLMGFIVVGDVDPDEMEAKIEAHLGGLKDPEQSQERSRPEIPSHEEVLVVIHPDPEVPRTSLSLLAKHDAVEGNTHGDYRKGFVESVVGRMLNERLRDVGQQLDPPFLGASVGFSRLSPSEGADTVGIAAHEDRIVEGFRAAMVEVERARRHGFRAGELERAKAERFDGMRTYYAERDTTASSRHAQELLRHLATGEPVPGVDYEWELAQRFIPSITLEECDAYIRDEWLPKTGRVIQLVMPEKDGLTPPTSEELLAVLTEVADLEIEAPADEVLDAPLLADVPPPGEVVERSEIPELGLLDWRLANGVRVLLKPTDFKADEISYRAWSHGGYSLAADELYVPARTASSVRARSGLGDFEASDLEKRLAGKKVSVRSSISNHGEAVSGSSSVADLETALQLAHLAFTAPRFDELGLTLERTSREASIKNRLSDPGSVMSDAFSALEWGNHPRYQPWTVETLEQLDLAASEAFYRERFADAADFTFLFVGNIDPDTFEPLAAKYLGSLPASEGGEARGDDGARRVEGVHTEVVRKGMDPQARVWIRFHGTMDDDWVARNQLYGMKDILSVLLREELREELGGVYGVGVRAGTQKYPESTYTFTVSWTCDPERVDELKEAAYAVMARVRDEGIDAQYVEDEKEKNRRDRETRIETNGFWLSSIASAISNEWDPLQILEYEARNDGLTAEVVQDAAKLYLNMDQRIELVLLPEEEALAE